MGNVTLQRQLPNKPLFADVLWSKPVNRKAAKKLLIVGGHLGNFRQVQSVYTAAIKAGIGEAKVVLPDKLRPALGNHPDCLFVASTNSGTLAKAALAEIKVYAEASDGLLLGPDLSQNAETITLVEQILLDFKTDICLSSEAIHLMLFNADAISFALNRLLVAPTKLLVKLAAKYRTPVTIRPDGGLLNQVNLLEALGNMVPAAYVLAATDLLVWSDGQVSHTALKTWYEPTLLGYLFTHYLQQPDKFKGLTTAAYELSQL
ncbi:hypothetical protein HY346_01100 [Candidatus Microgenomates bacterium]|nr:hypothetical protein [Candidatus Microgenomates bacterium]